MVDPHPQDKKDAPVIIIRKARKKKEHHGSTGVWKLAYADFVTVMMTFFLLMWLLNVTPDSAKRVIANYFNPINLINRTSSGGTPIGQENHDKKTIGVDNKKSGAQDENKTPTAEMKKAAQHLLDRMHSHDVPIIIDKTKPISLPDKASKERMKNLAGNEEVAIGDADRDPFSPDYWLRNLPTLKEGEEKGTQMKGVEQKQMPGKDKQEDSQNSLVHEKDRAQALHLSKPVAETLSSLSQSLKNLMSTAKKGGVLASVKLVPRDDGVVVQLSDQLKDGMFEVGSDVPSPGVRDFLAKIGQILNQYDGPIIISGYTDARPYRTTHYDNWQLSLARAQKVFYMLRDGGLKEERVDHIEGYADRHLKNTKDPNAAQNRRIEIFLKLTPAPSKKGT